MAEGAVRIGGDIAAGGGFGAGEVEAVEAVEGVFYARGFGPGGGQAKRRGDEQEPEGWKKFHDGSRSLGAGWSLSGLSRARWNTGPGIVQVYQGEGDEGRGLVVVEEVVKEGAGAVLDLEEFDGEGLIVEVFGHPAGDEAGEKAELGFGGGEGAFGVA